MSDSTKVCKKCGKVKSVSEFRSRKEKNGVRILNTCKQCEREYAQENRDTNPGKANEVAKKSYAKHAEERRAQRREIYAEDPEKGREYSREYRRENAEKVREADKARKSRNKERISEYRKKYYTENKK